MNAVVLCALCFTLCSFIHFCSANDFDEWCMSFGIACDSYSPDERSKREGIYAAYVDEVNAHNEKYERGEVTWKRTHRHHLADRTADEVRASRGGSGVDKMHLFHEKRLATSFASSLSPNVDDLPSHVDWRNISGSGRSALTPVKNQGACGSCWAFASVETLESHWFLKTGEMQELSTRLCSTAHPIPITAEVREDAEAALRHWRTIDSSSSAASLPSGPTRTFQGRASQVAPAADCPLHLSMLTLAKSCAPRTSPEESLSLRTRTLMSSALSLQWGP